MIGSLITSRTRNLLLLTFFSNVRNTGYLRGFAEEFCESTNSVRTELLRLADAGLLASRDIGRRRYYRANPRHPLYPELRNIVHKSMGLDQVRELLSGREDVLLVLAIGAYARGRDSGTIELMIVGRDGRPELDGFIAQAELASGRCIRPFLFSKKQFLELRRTLRLDDVLVLLEDEGAADELLERYRDPRWDGDDHWARDIRWETDTIEEVKSELVDVGSPEELASMPIEEVSSQVDGAGQSVEEDGKPPVEEVRSPVDGAGQPMEEDGKPPVEEVRSPVDGASPELEEASPRDAAKRTRKTHNFF